MRELKFRAWTKAKKMQYGIVPFQWDYCISTMSHKCIGSNGPGFLGSGGTEAKFEVSGYSIIDGVLMQFTGKCGFNKKDLYEGDIVFYEEAEETGDKRYYLVIVWIQEWSMFASLFIDEYKKYIESGIEEIDETMFWTYNLEHSDNYHYAGNIYENPDLLEKDL